MLGPALLETLRAYWESHARGCGCFRARAAARSTLTVMQRGFTLRNGGAESEAGQLSLVAP